MKLSIKNLSKTYPNGVKALDDLNLEIGKGMFGLLGPNGAGKSSLMRTIATLQQPDKGSISFNEINVLKDQLSLRKILGYLPQEFGVYPKVSAAKLLDYFAILKGVASKKERQVLVDKTLELTNLTDVKKKAVHRFSGGMKQRFGIAQLLLNQPKLIIVDEPTAGLDPGERQRFLNILRAIGTESTVIFSTHIVEDVRELCNDMAIMNGGKILSHCNPQKATTALEGQIWTRDIHLDDLEHMKKHFELLSSGYNKDNSIAIRVHALHQPSPHFRATPPSLEDVYFKTLKTKQHAYVNL